MQTIKIKHVVSKTIRNFNVEFDKLIYVLSKLENKEIEFESQEQIEALMKKHGLFDEYFLENVNKL